MNYSGIIAYAEERNIFGSELLNIHKNKMPDEFKN